MISGIEKNRTLLLVDDEPNVVRSIKRLLAKDGYIIYSANSAAEGLNIVDEKDIGVVVSDQMMPEMDGVAFLDAVRSRKPDIVRMMLTAYASYENAVQAINRSHIFEYQTKPWDSGSLKNSIARAFGHYNLMAENRRLHEVTHQQNHELKRLNEHLEDLVCQRTEQLQEAVNEGISMLALAAEAKDDNTGEHILRIKHICRALCLELEMPEKETEEISYFSMMHDVGKIHVPDHILKKKGGLTDEEMQIIQQHTIAGEKILGDKAFYKTARLIARSHHENWDGSGYPDGLNENEIPLPARIVSVADVFDALTNERPYKKAWPVHQAVAELNALSGKKFDPQVVKAMNALYQKNKIIPEIINGQNN